MTIPPSVPTEVVVLLVDDQMIVARAVRELFAEDQDYSLPLLLIASPSA